MNTYLLLTLAIGLVGGVIGAVTNSTAQEIAAEPNSALVMTSEVEWAQLNPAHGDKSPQAATLWGDRNGPEPTGFLLKPMDGFMSPPHIHNVACRGVVITGLIHNDDPGAKVMWMPAGSFWTQPAETVHITAATGSGRGRRQDPGAG